MHTGTSLNPGLYLASLVSVLCGVVAGRFLLIHLCRNNSCTADLDVFALVRKYTASLINRLCGVSVCTEPFLSSLGGTQSQEEEEMGDTLGFSKEVMEELQKEITFHDKYLHTGLEIVPHSPKPPTLSVLPLIDQGDAALYPDQIHPFPLPHDSATHVIVNCGQMAINNEYEIGTLAEVVARGKAANSDGGQVGLIRGLSRIRYVYVSPNEAKLIDEVTDESLPVLFPGCYDGVDVVLKRIAVEEDTKSSYKESETTLPICEALRVKFFRCQNALERRFFIRRFAELPDRAIHCRGCWGDEERKTILTSDVLRFSGTATCLNPAGYVFHLVLFRDENRCSLLQNVIAVGQPHVAHSWFPSFMWSYAVCRSCGNHLGWRFIPRRYNSQTSEAFWGIRTTEFLNSDQALRFFS